MAVGMMVAFTRIRKFPPSSWGKISTFFQIVAAVLWMAKEMPGFGGLSGLAEVALWVSVAFTVWSGVHYTWRGIRILRAH
jgi:phosphatidylglycerophosphate synthase